MKFSNYSTHNNHHDVNTKQTESLIFFFGFIVTRSILLQTNQKSTRALAYFKCYIFLGGNYIMESLSISAMWKWNANLGALNISKNFSQNNFKTNFERIKLILLRETESTTFTSSWYYLLFFFKKKKR